MMLIKMFFFPAFSVFLKPVNFTSTNCSLFTLATSAAYFPSLQHLFSSPFSTRCNVYVLLNQILKRKGFPNWGSDTDDGVATQIRGDM